MKQILNFTVYCMVVSQEKKDVSSFYMKVMDSKFLSDIDFLIQKITMNPERPFKPKENKRNKKNFKFPKKHHNS